MLDRSKNDLPLQIQLYAEMAELTRPKCGECRAPHSCCDPMYCDMAEEDAANQGVDLRRTDHPTLKFMGPTGCVVPPYLRKLCTLHVCSINGLGLDPKDPKFTRAYFELREKIENVGS